ncbi:DUF6602 domain-containing protein [Gilvimarinus xylanilyticus]|uniref:DUF6602 domain-containing protein n=1 Tax=Gilvimarinus xylanilyticus TaxID=2944139 RepID=A0A9X2I426_9GAMM|nr:DUF6602 domain-containing protein [Gilvimarinus xylanilyticus]MCP8899601.1 hypothetical protein [Gilvimarinus xylanilyticus]
MSSTNLAELAKIEEELMAAKLKSVRHSISHAAEKGRSLEQYVIALLKDLLPGEYGVSTGFIAYLTESGVRLSSQLDIIIYDALRSGPLIRLGTCDVFPLEAVYGYVEVKASICSSVGSKPSGSSIEECIDKNFKLRQMYERSFWVPMDESPVRVDIRKLHWLGLRSYVFAFESSGAAAKDIGLFSQRVSDSLNKKGCPAHLHGVYIADAGYVYTKPDDSGAEDSDDSFRVCYTSENSFAAFRIELMKALSTFPRPDSSWVPALERYYDHSALWEERVVSGSSLDS